MMAQSSRQPLSLTLRPITPHAPTTGGDVFLVATVTGSPLIVSADRRPLNLALVLDRSGSMAGEKLELVKNAALHLIHRLGPRDRVAIITYDNMVNLLVPSGAVTPDMLPTMSMALATVQPGGSTNLEGGWRLGVQTVAEQMEHMSGALHRVLLLTDGLANVGITENGPLASLAQGVASLGIVTSTFGVGTDYDETLLNAMAEAGGGNDYFIATADQIHATFQMELAELLSVVAEGVSVTLTLPEGVVATLVNPNITVTEQGEARTVPVGFLSADEAQRLVFRVTLPATDAGNSHFFTARAAWTGPDRAGDVTFDLNWPTAAALGEPDSDLLAAVAAQEAARARWEAYLKEKEGRHAEAAATLSKASASIAAYAPAAPFAATLVSEASEMRAGSSPEQRKRIYFQTQRMKRSKRGPNGTVA
jgi:Ca-activated chloride channel family protein